MEIAIISGKGGTGKSMISAAFATLDKKVVLADCDVDAANMFILFNPTHEEEQEYVGGQKAFIDYNLCINCGRCVKECRFDAISVINSKVVIFEIPCDGCKLCYHVCPVEAINMFNNNKSRLYSGSFRNGKMVYGRLAPGEENSGKLVNLVRDKAKKEAIKNNINTIIIDGPPGIGCPVISSITGVDNVIIVTEPTMSALEDMKRAMDVTSIFHLKTYVIINKYDINHSMTSAIQDYCKSINVEVIGQIKFDKMAVDSMVDCKSIIEYNPNAEISLNIKSIYNKLKQ